MPGPGALATGSLVYKQKLGISFGLSLFWFIPVQNRNKTLFPLLCLFGFKGQILSVTGGTAGLRTERSYSAGSLGMAITHLGKAIIFFTSEQVAHATTALAKKFICPRKPEQTWQKCSNATVQGFKMFTVLCWVKGRERQKEWSCTLPIRANHLGAGTQGQVLFNHDWMSLVQLCQSFCSQRGFWSPEWLNIANFRNVSALHFAYGLILLCPE